jgi:hypothetical protein
LNNNTLTTFFNKKVYKNKNHISGNEDLNIRNVAAGKLFGDKGY